MQDKYPGQREQSVGPTLVLCKPTPSRRSHVASHTTRFEEPSEETGTFIGHLLSLQISLSIHITLAIAYLAVDIMRKIN